MKQQMENKSNNARESIEIRGLGKTYLQYAHPLDRLKQALHKKGRYYTEKRALHSVSLNIAQGETVAIVGRNGSGKSTLLQLICGILHPTTGECHIEGRIASLLELGAGFNPEYTGKENIFLYGTIQGLSRHEIIRKYDEIVDFASIGDAIYQPVHTYSSGMLVRLAFAVAVAVDPDILVVDEALAVGDEFFQRKCVARIETMQQRGVTILFVSHSARMVIELCSRAILLDNGEMLMDGSPRDIIAQYHRLLFAPPSETETIRRSIRDESPGSPSAEPTAMDETGIFDPNLKPESTVAMVPQGTEITTYQLQNMENAPANLLKRGQEAIIHFRVHFSEAQHGVRFNCRIRSIGGVEIAGGNTHLFDKTLAEIDGNTSYNVNFRFHCKLLPGLYFITLGCSALVNGIRTPLHRITDAMALRVVDEPDTFLVGLVDLDLRANVTEIEVVSHA